MLFSIFLNVNKSSKKTTINNVVCLNTLWLPYPDGGTQHRAHLFLLKHNSLKTNLKNVIFKKRLNNDLKQLGTIVFSKHYSNRSTKCNCSRLCISINAWLKIILIRAQNIYAFCAVVRIFSSRMVYVRFTQNKLQCPSNVVHWCVFNSFCSNGVLWHGGLSYIRLGL